MTKILTKAKKAWAKNRNVVLRGSRLIHNASIAARYEYALRKLTSAMTNEVDIKIRRLFKTESMQQFRTTQDASIATLAKRMVNHLLVKFGILFGKIAEPSAETMVKNARATSKTTLHSSLQKLSGGLSLKTSVVPKGMEEIAQAIINENVTLIKSIPVKYLTDVSGAVMRSITTNAGLESLIKVVNKYSDATERRVKNIALDQTRKAYNTINKARMQALGVKQYEWVHSSGSRHPRKYHLDVLNGQIFDFDNPPIIDPATGEKGIPGQLINCGCTMTPVIELDAGE